MAARSWGGALLAAQTRFQCKRFCAECLHEDCMNPPWTDWAIAPVRWRCSRCAAGPCIGNLLFEMPAMGLIDACAFAALARLAAVRWALDAEACFFQPEMKLIMSLGAALGVLGAYRCGNRPPVQAKLIVGACVLSCLRQSRWSSFHCRRVCGTLLKHVAMGLAVGTVLRAAIGLQAR